MPAITENIVANTDDVYSTTGYFGLGFSTISAGRGPGGLDIWAGLRFQGIDIPQGTTINSATLTTQNISTDGTPTIAIYGDDVDDAAAWADATGNRPREITKTTASGTMSVGAGEQDHDVTDVVQEILNRGSWASGNDVRFGLFPPASGTSQRVKFADYTHATLAAASLEIDYEAAAVTAPAARLSSPRLGLGL